VKAILVAPSSEEVTMAKITLFDEPAETPAHNAMQIKFLDEIYREQVGRLYLNINHIPMLLRHEHSLPSEPEMMLGGWNENEFEAESDNIDIFLKQSYLFYQNEKQLKTFKLLLNVELKTNMGDDYPAVLRQIKRCKNSKMTDIDERPFTGGHNNDRRFMLIVEKYNGKGATWDNVVELFGASNITVVFESQVSLMRTGPNLWENEAIAARTIFANSL
jgi:hypothetical protein